MSNILWCDCKTDFEKLDFLVNGNGSKTGIVARAVESDLASMIEDYIDRINEMKCCGNCKHYMQMIDQIECEFYCAIEDRLDVTGVVNGNDKCDKWEMK
jgi:hypothetical protein